MKEAIERIAAELAGLKAATQKEAEEARVRFLGKKGEITALMEQFRSIARNSSANTAKSSMN